MVLPLGQSVGALLLLLVKGLAMLWLLPILGIVLTAVYIVYAHKQNRAYAAALLTVNLRHKGEGSLRIEGIGPRRTA